MLSLSSPDPVFLDGGALSATVGNAVVIIQNSVQSVSQELLCGKDMLRVTSNGRNPLQQGLLSVATLIGGLPPSHMGHRGIATSVVMDSTDIFDSERNGYLSHGSLPLEFMGDIDHHHIHWDWSLASGNSPRFPFMTSIPSFNELDVVSELSLCATWS